MKEIEWSPTSGADAGKKFVITRMSAFAADKWARHTIKALIQAGVKVPPSGIKAGLLGMSGLAMNIFGYMDNEECDKAFEALMKCAKIVRAGTVPSEILDADIDDAETLVKLREEAFKLHVDFFKAAAYQISPLVAALTPQGDTANPQAA
ncbi:hypothetical protein [Swingsia samuiensis]|uniref:Uncharacterized protein n=1 Tax=Swingsia samuiensis TaxID=1293412 RepID=A0A4Y6UM38_9PROT|nr:hypothetical protein [Swingsia samuiensis]QDH17407.1 hypothetical protein E3D00_07390 [Swingsia samuiensis]